MPTLTREELYELVWTTPLKALAARYHVSSIDLAKVCERLTIPRPTQGHWARLHHNHEINRPSLPPSAPGAPESVTLPDEPPASRPIPTIIVNKTLKGAHPAIERLSALVGTGGERDKMKIIPHRDQATFRAAPATQGRALCILDALCRWISQQGHRVAMQEAGDHFRHALVVGSSEDAFRISLLEKQTQIAHVLTAKEKADQARYGWLSGPPKFDHIPSGILMLEFLGMQYGRSYGRWADGKTTLESKLGAIGARVEEVFVLLAEDRARRAREAEVARAAERERALRLERERHHELLVTDLQNMAAQWEQAKRVRAFLEAAEAAISDLDGDRDARQAWISWAHSYVDSIDPLKDAAEIAKALKPEPVPPRYQWPLPSERPRPV